MSKLVAEVDKLLEKGKIPEAIEKLKSGIRSEPLNQLLVTKLANIYVEKGEPKNAVTVFSALASRLSEAGKSQVAIAIFKQAIDLDPLDFDLRVKFANENESCGKIADAHAQGQLVFQHYLKRKKYFDCAGLFPLLVRTQPKDEKLKQAWIEILQLSQAEQKMVHLLVALAGPPGLVSKEFNTGGDPTALAPQTFEGLKKLVPFFPRDPKIAYTLAWIAYKRGADKECYSFLREALRREPDFCLAVLLFARVLAEKKKLNESLFVYKYFKERMNSDKSTDLLTLNRLLEAFVEGNGWITFTDGMGVEELDSNTFISGLSGTKAQEDSSIEGGEGNDGQDQSHEDEEGKLDSVSEKSDLGAAPAEIELGAVEIGLPAADEAEILLTSGHTKQISPQGGSAGPFVAPPAARAPEQERAPQPSPKQELTNQNPAPKVQQTQSAAPVHVESPNASMQNSDIADSTGTVEFTSIIKSPTKAELNLDSEAITPNDAVPIAEKPNKAKTFNPLENIQAQADAPKESEFSDRTQIFSPVEILNANDPRLKNVKSVETRLTLKSPEELGAVSKGETASVPSIATTPSQQFTNQPKVEGESTQLFSPMESVQAGVDSRRPLQPSAAPVPPVPEAQYPVTEAEMPSLTATENRSFTATEAEIGDLEHLANEGEATQMFSLNGAEKEEMKTLAESEPSSDISFAGKDRIEKVLSPVEPPLSQEFSIDPSATESKPEQPQVEVPENRFEVSHEVAALPSEFNTVLASENVDLGDDLLEEPTRPIAGTESKMEATSVLIEEVRRELRANAEKKGPSATHLIDTLLKKAERFESKRNYYLARKALKHAQALGADEEFVKTKLSKIRKMEMPEALYLKESKDNSDKRSSDQIIRDLEDDFDLELEGFESASSEYAFGESLESVVNGLDLQTTIDFGIGIYEMGLYGVAEKIFLSAVERYPDDTFNSYYLAAIAKFAQKDFAGAASILKKLSKEPMRTEREKIQIFYALGEVFEKLKRLDQSQEFFQKVAKLDANYRNIRNKISGANG